MTALLVIWFSPVLLLIVPALCRCYDALRTLYLLHTEANTDVATIVCPELFWLGVYVVFHVDTIRWTVRRFTQAAHRWLHPNLYIRLAFLALV